jgi:hypothetical protein
VNESVIVVFRSRILSPVMKCVSRLLFILQLIEHTISHYLAAHRALTPLLPTRRTFLHPAGYRTRPGQASSSSTILGTSIPNKLAASNIEGYGAYPLPEEQDIHEHYPDCRQDPCHREQGKQTRSTSTSLGIMFVSWF